MVVANRRHWNKLQCSGGVGVDSLEETLSTLSFTTTSRTFMIRHTISDFVARPRHVAACALGLMLALPAALEAQQVVRSANSATQIAGNPAGGGAAQLNSLINQSGLQERTVACNTLVQCNSAAYGGSPLQYTSGVTLWDTYFAADPTHTTEQERGGTWFEWWSGTFTSSASIRFDFGTPIWLSGIAIWNEDAVSVGTFGLKDGNGNVLLSGQSLTDNQSWPTPFPYKSDRFEFAAVQTQYLTLDLSNCPFQNATFGNRCALGEVAFRQDLMSDPNANTTVPEPATVGLMAAGLAGIGFGGAMRRRRRGDTA